MAGEQIESGSDDISEVPQVPTKREKKLRSLPKIGTPKSRRKRRISVEDEQQPEEIYKVPQYECDDSELICTKDGEEDYFPSYCQNPSIIKSLMKDDVLEVKALLEEVKSCNRERGYYRGILDTAGYTIVEGAIRPIRSTLEDFLGYIRGTFQVPNGSKPRVGK